MPSPRKEATTNQFQKADLDRIVAETFVQRVEHHQEIGSTNDRAFQLAKEPEDQFPLLVVADKQTAGRGRGANTWWAGKGALTFSVLLATETAQLPTERWPQVSLTVGLAVCEAMENLLARSVPTTSTASLPAVQLKWPNDVYIEGRKICGILVEVPRDCRGRLLLGIGINVNNSLAAAPAELQDTATSLCDQTGLEFSLAEVLTQVLQQLSELLNPTDLWNAGVREGWRRRCFLTGKTIQVDLGTHHAVGLCRGINEHGALLLEVEGKNEQHLAGVITLVESE